MFYKIPICIFNARNFSTKQKILFAKIMWEQQLNKDFKNNFVPFTLSYHWDVLQKLNIKISSKTFYDFLNKLKINNWIEYYHKNGQSGSICISNIIMSQVFYKIFVNDIQKYGNDIALVLSYLKNNYEKNGDENFNISIKQFSKLIGISPSKIKTILNKMEELDLIKKEKIGIKFSTNKIGHWKNKKTFTLNTEGNIIWQ